MCLVYVVSLLPIIQIHALSSTFHGSQINNVNPTYTTSSQYTPRRISNGNQLVMRKQKASDRRTRRMQRGDLSADYDIIKPLVEGTNNLLSTTSPMENAGSWKHKSLKSNRATNVPKQRIRDNPSGGRGRSRKRSILYNSLASYQNTFLTLLTEEYKAEVSYNATARIEESPARLMMMLSVERFIFFHDMNLQTKK